MAVQDESPDLISRKVMELFLSNYGLIRHHLDSFAHFLYTTIPDVVMQSSLFKYDTEQYTFQYCFTNTFIGQPAVMEHDGKVSKLTPNECRLRNLTYSSPLFIMVEKKIYRKTDGQTIENNERVFAGMIPIMVRSIQCNLHEALEDELIRIKECPLDQGGYFIINGTERVLVGMEHM